MAWQTPTPVSWVTSARDVGAQWPLALLWSLSSIQASKHETVGRDGACIRDFLAKAWRANWDLGWRTRRQTGASWGISLCHHPGLWAKEPWVDSGSPEAFGTSPQAEEGFP